MHVPFHQEHPQPKLRAALAAPVVAERNFPNPNVQHAHGNDQQGVGEPVKTEEQKIACDHARVVDVAEHAEFICG